MADQRPARGALRVREIEIQLVVRTTALDLNLPDAKSASSWSLISHRSAALRSGRGWVVAERRGLRCEALLAGNVPVCFHQTQHDLLALLGQVGVRERIVNPGACGNPASRAHSGRIRSPADLPK